MSRVDSAASVLLDEMGINEPPVDVYVLAERLGVQVVRTNMNQDVSGMLLRDGDALTVGLNRRQAPQRQRFTLAHELGHLRLHRGRPLIVDSLVRVNLRDATSATATDREEIEANRFAASLLMPEAMIRAAVANAATGRPAPLQRQLAQLFDVSAEALGYRLINLGITT
jgi:Zn-dependent peptidase ImmA (M78 family)